MNKQGNKDNPYGGIEWVHILGPGTGWTANPVRGCKHECAWRMPTGEVARCYAKSIALKFVKHFPKGFEALTFHPSELREIEKKQEPCGIFVDSMSDLFGLAVPSEWINETLATIRRCPNHVFFSLTKNPRRLIDFAMPANLLVGVSAPPTFMFGKEMRLDQQLQWFERALIWLRECDAANKWLSLEPLSFDVSKLLVAFRDVFHWAVIGAASNGSSIYQPRESDLKAALSALAGLPVFYKGNIARPLADRNGGWREEFPVLRGVQRQESLAI